MKQRLLLRAIVLLVISLAVIVQVQAQCNGPMSVPVTGSGTGMSLTASETHIDATCVGSNGMATISATGGTEPYSGTGTFPQMAGTQEYTVTDANGCTATVSVTITVLDNTPPTIDCPSSTTVSPDPGSCDLTVTGTEYDPVVSDNCAVSSTMYTTISGSVSPPTGSSLAGAVLGAGTNVIEWKATDSNGFTNTCQFTLTVNACITISGNLIWKGDEIEGVGLGTVELSGDAADTDGPTPSGSLPGGGAYSLIANAGGDFVITPTKHIFVPPYTSLLNGLDVADATAIQQHLVGIAPITDEYRLVAADCNKSYTLSTVDAAIIKQSLLGNAAALAILNITKSWRFIPIEYVFPFAGPYTLPVFPETKSLTGVSSDVTGVDFFGVKVGDVIENANPAIKPDPEARPLVWRVRDRALKGGQQISLDFSVVNFTDIAAYQYAMSFDTDILQFESIEITGTGIQLDPGGNFGLFNIEAGELRTVWSVVQGLTLSGRTPLFRLHFTVLKGGMQLSDVLHLDSGVLSPVAYNSVLSSRELQLQFTDYQHFGFRQEDEQLTESATGIQLFQNRPNPFDDQTAIGFVLPEACAAQLRVLDVSGREIYRIDGDYPAGYNEATIRRADLNTTGQLIYELTTPYGTLSRQMTSAGW